jgi:hypothetical protein
MLLPSENHEQLLLEKRNHVPQKYEYSATLKLDTLLNIQSMKQYAECCSGLQNPPSNLDEHHNQQLDNTQCCNSFRHVAESMLNWNKTKLIDVIHNTQRENRSAEWCVLALSSCQKKNTHHVGS